MSRAGGPGVAVGTMWVLAALAVVVGGALLGCRERPAPPPKRETPAPAAPAGGAAERPAPGAPAGSAPAGAAAGSTTAARAEAGPDPDYPTPITAGTNDLFLMEEPVRGPHVTTATLPDAAGLTWSEHAFAELDAAGFALSPAAPPEGGLRWRVGREDGRVRLVERVLPGGEVVARWVLEWSAGAPPRLVRLVTLDEYGTVVEARSYPTDGGPAAGEGGGVRYGARELSGANALPGCGSLAAVVDERGLAAEIRCLAWHGPAMYDTDGVRLRRRERDAAGFVVAEARFGEGDQPVNDQSGVHRVTYERDAAGRAIRELRFDRDGAPARSTGDGCFGRGFAYDERGLLVAETCLDGQGRPTTDPDGVVTTGWTVDAAGCVVSRRALDAAGAPAAVGGVLERRWTVGPRCARLSEACFGAGGAPTACRRQGAAFIEYTRDQRGRVVAERFFERPGVAGGDADFGVFERRTRYDELGRPLEESCHGPDGRNVLCGTTGYHAALERYDAAGRLTDRRFLGVDRAPSDNMGTAIRQFEYDSYDHQVAARSLDARGRPTDSYGLTTRRQLYDPGHRLFGVLLYDLQDQPARYRGCYVGVECPDQPWHAVRIVRSPEGKVVRNVWFDHAGQRITTTDCAAQLCFD